MTKAEIRTEIQRLRFTSSTVNDALVNNWINQSEIAVWNAADWQFKRLPPSTNLTVTVSGSSPPIASGTLPTNVGNVRKILDPTNKQPLVYLDPDDFSDTFRMTQAPAGTAEFWTQENRVIYVGSAQAGTYLIGGRKRYSHMDTGVETVGVMDEDSDTPLWDSEHHYILVPWAITIGARLNQEPPPLAYVEQRDEMLATMKEELLIGAQDQIRYWGG